MQVLAIDLGGTQIRTAAVNEVGGIIEELKSPTEADKGLDHVLQNLFNLCDNLINSYHIEAIGIGVPGPIDYEAGIIINPPNLPGWQNVKLKNILAEKYHLPVALDRDANSALIGEHWLGAAKGLKNVALLTWGTGVGGAIIIDNHIYRGNSNLAGELGHMIIDENGPECPLGHRGCLESFIGGRSIEKKYGIPLEKIAQNLRSQDVILFTNPVSKSQIIISEIAGSLVIGLKNIITLFDPELILLDGGATQSIDVFYPFIKDLPVKVSPHALDAGILGAARVALNNINDKKEAL